MKVGNKVEVRLHGYFKPTPKLMRKIGDGLLTVSVAVTSYAALADKEWIVIASAIIGVLGKFMTNFFTDRK